ncbi:hypothetical protein [Catenuloplanes atrovinosus]|uniref:Uncharacterized protein n=1 Tax=Catenuloplanes atrovinosus TaxID=137266 RepID=A0AAE3YPI3_9ACTN|nr:hypothetical protein [Catenuloplanes atrovinosus]MDR7276272.1 hypothetical protein [Catenuloplanes atrovinosus]
MAGSDGYHVRSDDLLAHGGTLDSWSAEATAIAGTLRQVTADTGRADSDDEGRGGPADAAALLETVAAALTATGGRVRTCAADYTACDVEVGGEYATVGAEGVS